MIACIACGGMIEVTLIAMGLGAILSWFRKRHNKKKCKCCNDHDHDKKGE